MHPSLDEDFGQNARVTGNNRLIQPRTQGFLGTLGTRLRLIKIFQNVYMLIIRSWTAIT